jgi:hypothetical protein
MLTKKRRTSRSLVSIYMFASRRWLIAVKHKDYEDDPFNNQLRRAHFWRCIVWLIEDIFDGTR